MVMQMTMKKSTLRGFQKNSILSLTSEILETGKKPMTYEELFETAVKDYGEKSIKIKSPSVFRHRIREDIARRNGGSVFQVTGYREIGLKSWGYPEFDEEAFKRNLQEEIRANKKVSIIAATIEALEKNGEPMRVKEIFEYVNNHKKVNFKTKTPFKTVNSNITHEINKKGDESRFVRISKGLIGLREWSEQS